MIDPIASAPTTPAEIARASRVSLFRRMLTNPTGVVAIVVLLVIILSSVFAQFIAPFNPDTPDINATLAQPGGAHLLGTDSAGQDVFSRLLFAGRFSLAGALLALAISAIIGVTAGLFAGYYGKWFDAVSSWLSGLLMALPAIIVLLAARAVLGPSMWLSMAIFGVLISPAFFRLVYASVTAVRNELYVDAARVAGLSDFRIISRHILTVVRAPAIIQSATIGGIAIAIQAGLEFIGLGDQTIPTWGSMLTEGFSNIYSNPTLMLFPALVVALTCIALALLANAMRDELERSGGKKRRRRALQQVNIDAQPVITHTEKVAATGDRVFGEQLLNVTNLAVGYDQPDGSVKVVVNDVSLVVRRGEVHGLIGESGSGKTQTAWSVLRLLPEGGRIVAGSIVFEGTDLAKLGERELTKIRGRKIAYVPQEPMSNLDASFTIGSQLVEPMRVCLGISKREATKRALDLLAKVGIPNPKRTFAAYPHEVSGGMAQRVLIAGAISCDPDLLIADEPTTALDVTVQAEVLDLLRELQDELSMGVILVTHNFGVVADLCDRVSVMRDGRIVETGPVKSIFADPEHPYTKSLFDAILEDGDARGPLVGAGAKGAAS